MQAAIRSGSGQCSQLVALQVDRFVHAQQVGFGHCPPRLHLFDAAGGFQTVEATLVEQLQRFLAHLQRRFGGIALAQQAFEFSVGRSEGGGQRDARLRSVGFGRIQFGGSGGQCRPVLAPEIDFVAEVQCGLGFVVVILGYEVSRHAVVVTLLHVIQRSIGADLR